MAENHPQKPSPSTVHGAQPHGVPTSKPHVPLDPPGLGNPPRIESEYVPTKEDLKARENAAKGIRDDLPAMQEANRQEDLRRLEQTKLDVIRQADQKDAPAQQVVNPGDTVVAATVTLGALVTALYPTNTAPSPPANYTWVVPGVLQGVYGDLSMVTLRFEARAYQPTQIRTY